jgi:hypothetical protein
LGVLNVNIGLQVFCDMFLIKDGIPKAISFFLHQWLKWLVFFVFRSLWQLFMENRLPYFIYYPLRSFNMVFFLFLTILMSYLWYAGSLTCDSLSKFHFVK